MSISQSGITPSLLSKKVCEYCRFTEFYTENDFSLKKDRWFKKNYFICKQCGHGIHWKIDYLTDKLIVKKVIVDTRLFEDGFKEEYLIVGDKKDRLGISVNYWLKWGESYPNNKCAMCKRPFNDALLCWDELWNELRCPECGTNHRKFAKTLFCLNCQNLVNRTCISHKPTYNKIIKRLNQTGEILPCQFFQ